MTEETMEDAAVREPDYRAMYEEKCREHEAYRAEAEAREAEREKQRLYEALLRRAGVRENRIGALARFTGTQDLTLTDGRIAGEAEHIRRIRREWPEFISAEQVETPLRAERVVTRESILAMADPRERQRAIAENHELFGI